MKLDLLIRDGRLCREDLRPARGSIGVRDGRIAVVAATSDGLEAAEVIDAGGRGAPHASEFWTEGCFSIYEGQRLTGWPTHVVSRGRVLLRDGTLVATRGGGRFLRAPSAGA